MGTIGHSSGTDERCSGVDEHYSGADVVLMALMWHWALMAPMGTVVTLGTVVALTEHWWH